jgi:hypothetical protein
MDSKHERYWAEARGPLARGFMQGRLSQYAARGLADLGVVSEERKYRLGLVDRANYAFGLLTAAREASNLGYQSFLTGPEPRLRAVAMLPRMLERDRREIEAGARSPSFETWDRICKLSGWPQTFTHATTGTASRAKTTQASCHVCCRSSSQSRVTTKFIVHQRHPRKSVQCCAPGRRPRAFLGDETHLVEPVRRPNLPG